MGDKRYSTLFVADSTQQQPATTRQLGEYTSFREKHIYIPGLQKNLVSKTMKRWKGCSVVLTNYCEK